MDNGMKWILRLTKMSKSSRELLKKEFKEVVEEEKMDLNELDKNLENFYYNIFFKDQKVRKDTFKKLLRLAKHVSQ